MSENRDGNAVFTASQAKGQGFSTRNVMKDDFGMEIPVESVPLPSRDSRMEPEAGNRP